MLAFFRLRAEQNLCVIGCSGLTALAAYALTIAPDAAFVLFAELGHFHEEIALFGPETPL